MQSLANEAADRNLLRRAAQSPTSCYGRRGARILAKLAPVIAALVVAPPTTWSQAQGKCNASNIDGLIGKQYSVELAETARRASGATIVRPSGPGRPSSADVRFERLNVLVDAAGVVIGFRCG